MSRIHDMNRPDPDKEFVDAFIGAMGDVMRDTECTVSHAMNVVTGKLGAPNHKQHAMIDDFWYSP